MNNQFYFDNRSITLPNMSQLMWEQLLKGNDMKVTEGSLTLEVLGGKLILEDSKMKIEASKLGSWTWVNGVATKYTPESNLSGVTLHRSFAFNEVKDQLTRIYNNTYIFDKQSNIGQILFTKGGNPQVFDISSIVFVLDDVKGVVSHGVNFSMKMGTDSNPRILSYVIEKVKSQGCL